MERGRTEQLTVAGDNTILKRKLDDTGWLLVKQRAASVSGIEIIE